MIDRVNRYYQLPASRALVQHLRNDIGFTDKYVEIYDDLRDVFGSTQVHADNVGLPLKQYNAMAGLVGQQCICELIRLAEIGLKADRMSTDS